MNKKKGFTFVEVLVAIGILVVIVAILVPSIIFYAERSRAQKDESATSEIVRAVELAVAEDDIFDEVFHYSIKNNFITYTDSNGEYGVTVEDGEYWAPDGSGKAVTITFNPVREGMNSNYNLANGIVNDMTYGNGSVINPQRQMTGCEAYESQCYVSEMKKDDVVVSALLYNKVRSIVGETVELHSETYKNSSFTVFVVFTVKDGLYVANVYGSFNGTNLDPTSLAALGTGTDDYDDDGRPNHNNNGGKVDAIFDNTDLLGGGIATYRKYDTYTEDCLDKSKFHAFCADLTNKNKYKLLSVSTGRPPEEGTVDVSTKGDGNIVAWTENDGVFIGYKNGGKLILLPEDSSDLFNNVYIRLPNLITISLNKANTSRVTNAYRILANNANATHIDIGGWKLENNKRFDKMFYDDFKVKDLRVESFDTKNATTMQQMFLFCFNISRLDVDNWDTSKVTNFSSAFQGCTNLATLNVKNFNTASATNMSNMFDGDTSLKSLDVSKWKTDKVVLFDSMFKDCTKLKELSFGSWKTTKATSMSSMFMNCNSIEELDLSTFNTAQVTNFANMFAKCEKMYSLNISKFDTSKAQNVNKMFDDMKRLEEISFGNKFTFKNDVIWCKLPNPSSVYINGATGLWIDEIRHKSYAGDKLPNNIAATYFAAGSSNLAVLAPRNNWWRGHTPQSDITRIVIVNSYNSNTYKEKFNADKDNNGDIQVFVEDNIAYIVNNKNKRSIAAIRFSADASSTFEDFTNLKNITGLKLMNVTNAKNINNLFGRLNGNKVQGCTKLAYIDGIENWDVSNIQTASYAFAGINVERINLSNWVVSSMTDISGMFYGAQSQTIDLSGWSVEKVRNFDKMFNSAKKVGSINITGWEPSQEATFYNMFENCPSLTTISASNGFSLNNKTISMFNGSKNIQGSEGTKYKDDTSKYAHVDKASNPGYFSSGQPKANFSAKLYNTGSVSEDYTELTTSGATADPWNYKNGSRLLEISLYNMEAGRDKTVEIQVPMGMTIVSNSWIGDADDIKSINFTPNGTETNGALSQGKGKYTNNESGKLTIVFRPYVTYAKVSCQVMFDTTMWDKCAGSLSPRTDNTYTCSIDSNTTDIVKGDPVVVSLDGSVTKKISHVKASTGVGAKDWGWNYSIWQQSTIQYITKPGSVPTGYAHNGNYLDSIDRSGPTYYFDKVEYTFWATSTDSSGKEIRARIYSVNNYNKWNTSPKQTWYYVNPNTGATSTSTQGDANLYKVVWKNPYGANMSFPNVNLQLTAEDGFQAGKQLTYHYQIKLTTASGRVITIRRDLVSSIKSQEIDYTLFAVGGCTLTSLPESYYASADAISYQGRFFAQNACLKAIDNIDMEVTFDSSTAANKAPKLKVFDYRVHAMENQTVNLKITLTNDSGTQKGPYDMSFTNSNKTSSGILISVESLKESLKLTGNWYLKKIKYTIPTVSGSAMKTYLSASGAEHAYNSGGTIWGRLNANTKSTLKYTCGGLERSATITHNVKNAKAYRCAYIPDFATPKGSTVEAGKDFELDLQLAAHPYQSVASTSQPCSQLFKKPVVYAVLPVGVDIKGVIIGDTQATTVSKATPIVTYQKTTEIDGVLCKVYKIAFNKEVVFGYRSTGVDLGGLPQTSQWVRIMCSTDSAMDQTSINIKRQFCWTNENDSIYGVSSYGAAYLFADDLDVDCDDNTTEKFATLKDTSYIRITN